MGTFCQHIAHYSKSFFDNIDAPSRVLENNAAKNINEEEEKSIATTVTAAEVAAPGSNIERAPDH